MAGQGAVHHLSDDGSTIAWARSVMSAATVGSPLSVRNRWYPPHRNDSYPRGQRCGARSAGGGGRSDGRGERDVGDIRVGDQFDRCPGP